MLLPPKGKIANISRTKIGVNLTLSHNKYVTNASLKRRKFSGKSSFSKSFSVMNIETMDIG